MLNVRGYYYATGEKHGFCNIWRLASLDRKVYLWYSVKWINFFISSAVVPDEDGNWDGITVWARAPLAELSLGPGPGQVFCPWTSEEPSAAFSIVALEHDQQQRLWAKDNDNFALKQQLAEKEAAMAEQAAELEKLKSELQQAKAEAEAAAAMAAAAPGEPAGSNQPAQKVQKT